MPDITNNSRLLKRRIYNFEAIFKVKNADGTQLFNLKTMQAVINYKMDCIDKYAWIVHDQDTYYLRDETANPAHKAGTLRPAHVHLIVRFKNHQRQLLEEVCSWFDIAPHHVGINIPEWDSEVRYLVHADHPEKHQYDLHEIYANFDVESIITSDK